MALHDARGLTLSGTHAASSAAYDAALAQFNTYSLDPLATIDAALEQEPDFASGHLLRAALMMSSTERAALPAMSESLSAVQRCGTQLTPREHSLAAALHAWAEGRFHGANQALGRHLTDHPRDLLAVQVAHLSDFYLGQSALLRDHIARVLPQWSPADPGYSYLLGMYAFGLEECNEYGRAEATAREALALDRGDAWAVHAVGHVMEMQGRTDEGVRWLDDRQADWAPDNMFAVHNWWHLALFHLERDDIPRVLSLYDEAVRSTRSEVMLDMVDASALLWRLMLRRVDVGARWRELAGCWSKRVEDRFYAFNDVHAMMAFVGEDDRASAQDLVDGLLYAAGGEGSNAAMAREVALPLCAALRAFGDERYGACVETLLPVLPIAHRFGGSHAQRDLLHLTALEAALRADDRPLARALAGERLARKPASPANLTLANRAGGLRGTQIQASVEQ